MLTHLTARTTAPMTAYARWSWRMAGTKRRATKLERDANGDQELATQRRECTHGSSST